MIAVLKLPKRVSRYKDCLGTYTFQQGAERDLKNKNDDAKSDNSLRVRCGKLGANIPPYPRASPTTTLGVLTPRALTENRKKKRNVCNFFLANDSEASFE